MFLAADVLGIVEGGIGGAVAAAVAALIRRQRAEARGRHRRELVTEAIAEAREAMAERVRVARRRHSPPGGRTPFVSDVSYVIVMPL